MSKSILAVGAICILLLSGCGVGANATGQPTATPSTISAPIQDSGQVEPVLASSELTVGQNRVVVGILDAQSKKPIQDVPEVSLQFFKVHDDGTATKVGDANTVYRSENLPAGVFVAHTEFDEPGAWGALVTVKRQLQTPQQVPINFKVVTRGTVPMIGDPAPPSQNDTVKTVPDIKEICSAVPPDDMHEMTIADAVKSGKPTLILFAAPGFCPSFTCGPDLEMVQALESKYRDKANFIHIESPNEIQNHTHTGTVDANHNQEPGHQGVWRPQVQTANDWGLKTEPWLFLVDKNGKLADRFEGGLTIDEVEPAFLKVVQP